MLKSEQEQEQIKAELRLLVARQKILSASNPSKMSNSQALGIMLARDENLLESLDEHYQVLYNSLEDMNQYGDCAELRGLFPDRLGF